MKNKFILLIATLALFAITAGAQTVKRLPQNTVLDYDANYVVEFTAAHLARLSASSTNVTVNVFPSTNSSARFAAGTVVQSAYVDLVPFRNSSASYTNLLISFGDTNSTARILTAFQADNGNTNRTAFVGASTIPFAYTNANQLVFTVQSTNATASWNTYTSGVLRVYLRMTPQSITTLR